MPPKRPQPKKSPPLSSTAKPTDNKNRFKARKWDTANTGERVIIYADGGRGKTTLSSLAPKPVFLALSDGGREVRDPITNEKIDYIPSIANHEDLLLALEEPGVFDGFDSIILDDYSVLQRWIKEYIVRHYPLAGGKAASNFRDFGWDKAGHLVREFTRFNSLIDKLVNQNKTFIGIAHESVINIAGAEQDYIICTMDLDHQKGESVRNTVFYWADHVVQIDFADKEFTDEVVGQKVKTKISGRERAIFTSLEANYCRKSRTPKNSVESLPPCIQFSHKGDCTFWSYLFPDRYELVDESGMIWELK